MSNHNVNANDLKREASTETIRPSKQTHCSPEGIWLGASNRFGRGVSRSSSPVMSPPSTPVPSDGGYHQQNRTTGGHIRRLSVHFAAATNGPRQNSEDKENVQDGATRLSSLYLTNPPGIPSDGQAGLRPRGVLTTSDRENTHEAQKDQFSQVSKWKEHEASGTTTPTPSTLSPSNFRVTNADSESEEDDIDSDEGCSPLASPQMIVPSSLANAIHIRPIDGLLPRFSFRIMPQNAHATFWDAHNGGKFDWVGCLELIDTMQETYYHHAEILVRSYVKDSIRGRESKDCPEFVIRYKEPPRRNGSSTKGDSSVDVAAIEAAGIASRAPSTIRFKLDDVTEDAYDEERPEIRVSDWAQLENIPLQTWRKYFSIPIPAKLFETRETRTFRVEARVSFLSKLTSRRQHEMRADTIQVSVTHLLSERELGIRRPPETRADRCNQK